MTGFPAEIDLRRTPHFLFETGSILLLACSILFVLSASSTAAITYATGTFLTIGVLASTAFGLLALLGLGLLYWSSKLAAL
jgi:hypothetical protein